MDPVVHRDQLAVRLDTGNLVGDVRVLGKLARLVGEHEHRCDYCDRPHIHGFLLC
jgi:hypothetical protein